MIMHPIPRCRPPVSGVADEQHQRWDNYIGSLERVADGEFSTSYDPERRPPEEVYADYYHHLANALDPLFDNYARPGAVADKWDSHTHPIERTMVLLRDAPRFAEQHNMRAHLHDLKSDEDVVARSPWSGMDRRISYHVYRMTDALEASMPTPDEVWDNKTRDIVPSGPSNFDSYYHNFLELEKITPMDESDRKRLITKSYQILLDTFQDLHLPLDFLQIPTNFFAADGTPTYVEFSATSDKFKNGYNGRPGLLSVKQRLGGRLTGDEGRDVHKARVPAPAPGSPAPPAGPRAYGMTIDNIQADLKDLETAAALRNGLASPDPNQIVTPTWQIRASTLDSYKANFKSVLRALQLKFFKPSEPPDTQNDRDEMLAQLRNWIDHLRETTRGTLNRGGAANMKEARINVFAIKYLRSLCMQLIWESEPAKSEADVRTALADRLRDWILHEEVWNVTDTATTNRSITETHRTVLQNGINVRRAKIVTWQGLETQLRGEPAPAPAMAPAQPADKQQTKDHFTHLMGILRPSKPSRTIDYSEKIEKRREDWARACADARAEGTPVPARPDLNDVGAKVAANAALTGSPPDYDEMPTDTNWEKLAKMIVMTHWRFYQSRIGA